MKRKFKIFNRDEIRYDLFDNGYGKIKLKVSKCERWAEWYRGKTILKLKDTGDNVKLSLKDTENPLSLLLDYSQIVELYLSLQHYFTLPNTDSPDKDYKIINIEK